MLDVMTGSLPSVKYCNWEKFKNCFSKDDVRPAIDVLALYHGDDLDEQIEEEQIRRLPPNMSSEGREAFEKERIRRGHLRHEKRDEIMRLERVRIKSRHVLEFLAQVTGETFQTERPHTFLRPFKFLIHHHQKLEDAFGILEEKFRSSAEAIHEMTSQAPEANTTDQATTKANTQVDGLSKTPGDLSEVDSADSADSDAKLVPPVDDKCPGSVQTDTTGSPVEEEKILTLEEQRYNYIKCYMEFARAQLMPTYRKFQNQDHNGNPKIRYEDLWSLFRPGELVFQRGDESESANNNADSHRLNSQDKKGPRVWRVCFIGTEGVDWEARTLYWTGDLRGKCSNREDLEPVAIDAYHLDFNGEQYEPALWVFDIDRWEGEKAVTSLPLYPVRFHKDASNILDEYRKRGERFQKLLMQGHLPMEYNGWTLSKNPVGKSIRNWDNSTSRPEYVSSDVIIDHQEALHSNLWWRPPFDIGKVREDSTTRTGPWDRFHEIVVEFENIGQVEYHTLAKTDDFVVDPTARTFEKNTAKKKLSPEDLSLLPNRLFVYSLRDRKFINANIDCLKEIKPIQDPWRKLKIAPHMMELIKNTVNDHFSKKRLQRELHALGQESLEQDFIRTKGRGLVFLLHGPPGVGKTATAKAVASAHRKPLFSLACFDLGVDPGTVEARLSAVFRLANQWECVLLLDEANIFLSHREKKDDNLHRNAIVSTFLRTMEYYPGILFLTTNRPGALDEALSSRVHISLAFGELNYRQTRDIFQMNIDRCQKIADQCTTIPGEPQLKIDEQEILDFAEREFEKCEPAPFWNGRVIRNSFQIAMSLAYLESAKDISAAERTTADVRLVQYLGKRQFKKVLKIFQDFKNYREIMFNKSDERLAHERGDRAAASSLLAASKRESDHGRAGLYGTPRHSPAMARSSRPSYHKDYPDSHGRNLRESHGVRSRYGLDDDVDNRPRNSRGGSDRDSDSESDSDYRRQPARKRDKSHDYDHERERDFYDGPLSRRGYDPTARKAQSNRSAGEETPAVRGKRSKTPSSPPRRKAHGEEQEDDEQHRRRGYA